MNNRELLKIIATEEIRDQSELLEKIKALGFDMTQSTLSRRLHKMGVKKKHGVYIVPNSPDISISSLIKRIDEAPPNLLVLHTPPGHAHALAFKLDYMSANDPDSTSIEMEVEDNEDRGFYEIVGTIAGDDTVIVVVRPGQLENLKRKIIEFWK